MQAKQAVTHGWLRPHAPCPSPLLKRGPQPIISQADTEFSSTYKANGESLALRSPLLEAGLGTPLVLRLDSTRVVAHSKRVSPVYRWATISGTERAVTCGRLRAMGTAVAENPPLAIRSELNSVSACEMPAVGHRVLRHGVDSFAERAGSPARFVVRSFLTPCQQYGMPIYSL